jgi:hypothetical protein
MALILFKEIQMPQFSDDLFLGIAVPGGSGMPGASDGGSPISTGVGPLGRVYLFEAVPAALNNAGIAAAQQILAAGNLVLTAGVGVTTRNVNGEIRYVLDYARCVTLTSGGAFGAVNFTITGYDIYGQRMTVTRTGPAANTVATLKAFKEIVSVSASAALGTNVSVGFNDTLGLPLRVIDIGYILAVKYGGLLPDDAGTPVVADQTSPATGATGDVRGTYTLSLAANGARRLVMLIAAPGIASGPNATRVGAFGVTQA